MDWNALGTWVAGLATLAVVLYAIYNDRLKRPKLILSFDGDRDVKSQTNTVGLDPSTGSRWLRVRVENAPGRRVAKNCRAFVIGIERVWPGGKGEDVFPNDVRPLVWTHDPSACPSARDLLPGVRQWVDVVRAVEGRNALEACVQPAYSLKSLGDYVFTVQVSAEDADPAVIKVRVRWGGGWEGLVGQAAGP